MPRSKDAAEVEPIVPVDVNGSQIVDGRHGAFGSYVKLDRVSFAEPKKSDACARSIGGPNSRESMSLALVHVDLSWFRPSEGWTTEARPLRSWQIVPLTDPRRRSTLRPKGR